MANRRSDTYALGATIDIIQGFNLITQGLKELQAPIFTMNRLDRLKIAIHTIISTKVSKNIYNDVIGLSTSNRVKEKNNGS